MPTDNATLRANVARRQKWLVVPRPSDVAFGSQGECINPKNILNDAFYRIDYEPVKVLYCSHLFFEN